MTDADKIFGRFPDFIQEYIYSHSWESLRGVQVAAAHTIFETDNDLLLTSSTASGKTEAAFFPVLTLLMQSPPASVGVLYVAPLKSLINDQFSRIEQLLDQSGIPVTHWHGDVAASHKKKLLDNPQGILQITPESLEAMLINRSNDIVRIFGDLRFVIIDEIHTLTGTDRGNQILCQLARIQRLTGHIPRRIGLSATVGDPALAAAWLSSGSERMTDVPEFGAEKLRWRLGLEHFYIQNQNENQVARPGEASGEQYVAELDAGYEYMYDCVKDKKSLAFSNSREEDPLPNTPLPQLIPWGLLRAIAIIQLYIEERFIEPPRIRQLPFSLLFHQTLSVLAASGELTPRRLAERVLSLPPFKHVPRVDYKTLIISMLEHGYIEMTEEKGLIVGLSGERLLNSFKFYAVFKDSEDYTVRCGSDEIGTITTPPPVGDRFALAGRVWEVEELDIKRKLIYVKSVEGKMEVSWPGDYGEIHTKVLERMRRVLAEDTVYPYLKPNAVHRLEVARHLAANTGMLEHSLIRLGGYSWCLFPWLGTRSFRTLRRFIAHNGAPFKVTGLDFEGCCYMTFRMERGDDYSFISHLCERAGDNIDCRELVGENELPIFDKYDTYVPGELLRREYAVDRLRGDEVVVRLREILAEYEMS